MAIIVNWPDGRKEEFFTVRLYLGREFADQRMIILEDAEVFIGANSCTIKEENSIKLYPYAIVREIGFFLEKEPSSECTKRQ